MPLVCATALPVYAKASAERRLRQLCSHWERCVAPRLSFLQLAHCRRFYPCGNALGARASRLLARLLALHALPKTASLDMDSVGRPLVCGVPGWEVAFSHSGHAAFCLLQSPEEMTPDWPSKGALDAEPLEGAPPADRGFPGPASSPRAALRRWVLAEALFKALGSRPACWAAVAAAAHKGAAQRTGIWRHKSWILSWRLLVVPGHPLCVVLPNAPATPIHLRWFTWQTFT